MAAANAASSASGNQGLAQNVMNIGGGGATTSTTNAVEPLAVGPKNTEVISILKRRNNSSENINENLKYTSSTAAIAAEENSLSLHSQTYSDSSLQKYDGDDHNHNRDDDDDDDESDSDWDGFQVSVTHRFVPLIIIFLCIEYYSVFFLFIFRIANGVAADLICPI